MTSFTSSRLIMSVKSMIMAASKNQINSDSNRTRTPNSNAMSATNNLAKNDKDSIIKETANNNNNNNTSVNDKHKDINTDLKVPINKKIQSNDDVNNQKKDMPKIVEKSDSKVVVVQQEVLDVIDNEIIKRKYGVLFPLNKCNRDIKMAILKEGKYSINL